MVECVFLVENKLMQLLDHFHPPLSMVRHWESFHARWAAAIADVLNDELLPTERLSGNMDWQKYSFIR